MWFTTQVWENISCTKYNIESIVNFAWIFKIIGHKNKNRYSKYKWQMIEKRSNKFYKKIMAILSR